MRLNTSSVVSRVFHSGEVFSNGNTMSGLTDLTEVFSAEVCLLNLELGFGSVKTEFSKGGSGVAWSTLEISLLGFEILSWLPVGSLVALELRDCESTNWPLLVSATPLVRESARKNHKLF